MRGFSCCAQIRLVEENVQYSKHGSKLAFSRSQLPQAVFLSDFSIPSHLGFKPSSGYLKASPLSTLA